MNTEELLAVIASAKTRADVVPAVAAILPPRPGAIDWPAVNAAIIARWSKAARLWIFMRAWRTAERRGGALCNN